MVKRPVGSQIHCKVCGCSVQDIQCLAKHMRRHIGQRPFKCKVCGTTYVNWREIKRHEWLSHRSATTHVPAVSPLMQMPVAAAAMVDLQVAARDDPLALMYHNEVVLDHDVTVHFDNLIAEVAEVAMDRLDKVALGVEQLARECVCSAIGISTGFDDMPCDVDDLTPTIFFVDEMSTECDRKYG